MRSRRLAAGLAVLAWTPSALAAGTPATALDAARLGGDFAMTGVVTRAVGVAGEQVGEHVTRIWAFLPSCTAGGCPTIALVRKRAGGTDELLLQRRGPAFYSGTGAFYAPVRCHGRRYAKGALVVFTITVRITGAVANGPVIEATEIHAHYRNPARLGLTPCFSAPSYDSASYDGAPLAAGAIRSVPSTRSSTGS